MATTHEPCASCEEETAIGSIFYSDRRVIETEDDAGRVYLCSTCNARIRNARQGRPLSDDEARRLAENGSMAFLTFTGGGPIL